MFSRRDELARCDESLSATTWVCSGQVGSAEMWTQELQDTADSCRSSVICSEMRQGDRVPSGQNR
jgi:hypothetical protein